MPLHNTHDRDTLRRKLEQETFRRITLSFYRYVHFTELTLYRDQLWVKLNDLGVLGRVYLASEGINAQVSIPEQQFEKFRHLLNEDPSLNNVPLKIAVEDNGKSFYKLIVRVKNKIVADGLPDNSFNVSDVGRHLSAREFNEAMTDPGTIVLDMRNHYESEVGRFKGALCPEADTFREALDKGLELVKDQKEKKLLLYCTGGIRCEKASSWFRHHGYKDVNQLHGGIIEYARQVKQQGLTPLFEGKNFVFDDRLGERITNDILSNCHQCGIPCDNHVNCANDDCHLLFIQCDNCKENFNGCCSKNCRHIISLSFEEQRRLRKGRRKTDTLAVYKSRLRPDLKQIIRESAAHVNQ